MRFLLDTNVIIPLEDSSKILERPLAEFIRSAKDNNHVLLYHPATIDDINRDKNSNRRKISLSRLVKYHCLSEWVLNRNELEKHFSATESLNDDCDNQILLAVYQNYVDFLITEDVAIHRKSRKLGISERVLYVLQACNRFPPFSGYTTRLFPGISESYLSTLSISQKIFDSLKNSYPEFENWFCKCQREGRQAWTVFESNVLEAILIYKHEKNAIIDENGSCLIGKSLKLCTYKVSELSQGNKYGELLLKKAFIYAFENEIDWVYLTVRKGKQPHLTDMLEVFGFKVKGELVQKNGEIDIVYAKAMRPQKLDLEPFAFASEYYPWFKCSRKIKKFLIPIMPEYHRQLFPEIQNPFDIFGSYNIAGNAIRQAYVCNSNTKKIRQGDVVYFYRSGDLKEITSIGVVESVEYTTNLDRIVQLTRKRTVYELNDLEKMSKKGALIILFKMTGHLSKPVSNTKVTSLDIKGTIQTIREITDEQARRIAEEGRVANCIYAN